ncbi:hypothetical protein BJV78DRAFT_1355622 [Lactifluus subvellereus]|nr:hypothetical protein BJV78DRAFT_1355622 [Lactifluus subvellereus]
MGGTVLSGLWVQQAVCAGPGPMRTGIDAYEECGEIEEAAHSHQNQYPTKDTTRHWTTIWQNAVTDDNEQAWFDQVNTDGYEKLILCSAEPIQKTIGGQVVNMRSYKLKEAAQLACAWCTGRWRPWSSPARSGPGVREDLRTLDDE